MSMIDHEKRRSERLQFLFGVEPGEDMEMAIAPNEAYAQGSKPVRTGSRSSFDKQHNLSGRYDEDKHPPTTKIQTLANFVKANIGTGVLSLAVGFKHAGIVVGSIGTILVGFICTYCMHQLLIAYKKVEIHGKNMDYADVVEAAFERSNIRALNKMSNFARNLTNGFMVFTQMGLCTVYLMFTSKMIREVVVYYLPEYSHISIFPYIAGVTLLLIPYCFVTTLSLLAAFSTIANILSIGCLVVILQYVVRNLQPIENVELVTDASGFFAYFGSVMFAYVSIALVLPLENRMKDRDAFQYWDGLLSLGMTSVIGLYTAVGFYGYLCFGQDSVLILRNLPDHWVYHVTKLTWGICIFVSYNLQLYPPVRIIWPFFKEKCSSRFCDKFGQYILRTCFILFTFALAASVPCLEQMIALVGALAVSWIGLFLPPVLDIVTHLPQKPMPTLPEEDRRLVRRENGQFYKPRYTGAHTETKHSRCKLCWVIFRCTILIGFSFAGCIVGSYVTILEIVGLLSQEGGCSM